MQRREEGGADGLEAGAVGDAGVQGAVGAFDRQVAVGRPGVAAEPGAVDAGGGEVGGQRVAVGVLADRGEEPDRAAEPGEGAGDVLGDAAGLAGDAARHVGAGREGCGGAADEVPVGGADAEEGGGGRRQAGENSSLT